MKETPQIGNRKEVLPDVPRSPHVEQTSMGRALVIILAGMTGGLVGGETRTHETTQAHVEIKTEKNITKQAKIN